MAGVEAAFVVGLIASVISIIDATKTVFDAAKDAKGQPEAFRLVAARLPTVIEILHNAEKRARTLDETAQEALEPLLESCKAKAENLKKIFQKVIRKEGDNWYDRYKKALGTVGKADKVESLMEGILKDIQVLACEKLMGIATEAQMKEIGEAIKEMKEMPSSFQEEAGVVTQNHLGSGNNNANTGRGAQHNGTGDLYQIEVSGGATFGNNSINPNFNISNYYAQWHLSEPETQNYLQDLQTTDPRDDKKRIEQTKGGLLKDSYRWILEHADFQRWRDDKQSPLLWIKGDPGKGKTMLLCGIVDEISPMVRLRDKEATTLLSFFFCQATDSSMNNATAVVRGLIYMLISYQPSLVSHIQEKHNQGIKKPFEGINAWVALSTVFQNILQDPSLKNTYLIIDALDECEIDLPKLLDLIFQSASASPRVKWIVSSRNKPDIEAQLRLSDIQTISLELNSKNVSYAVEVFINFKVSKLPLIRHNRVLQKTIQGKMHDKANGTFLWAALVLKELETIQSWDVLEVLQEMPRGLEPLYDRMMGQVEQLQRREPEFCRLVLSTMTLAYRPLHLLEVGALSGLPEHISNNLDNVMIIVNKCGSFLTVRENHTYFIHQSAKDFFLGRAFSNLFPSGMGEVNYTIFSRSLDIMSKTLQRNIFGLHAPGFPIDMVKQPDPDPLSAVSYSCVYWVDHLHNWHSGDSARSLDNLEDGGAVDRFLRRSYLYWLEALSLIKSMPQGVLSMAKLEDLLQEKAKSSRLIDLVRDTRRFLLHCKWLVENRPLQVYTSALLFSPTRSITRDIFKEEEPKWITAKPAMEDNWSACLQTLEAHTDKVSSVAFSFDTKLVVSASADMTVKIWDAATGQCLQTLKGHSDWVKSIAFSPDASWIASASDDKTVKLWDAATGYCRQTLEGHTGKIYSVAIAPNGSLIASASVDSTVKIWNAVTGQCLQTLEGHTSTVWAVTFSPNTKLLASASEDHTIKFWNVVAGHCLRTLKGHTGCVTSVAFSFNTKWLASTSADRTVKIWDVTTGQCLQTLWGHGNWNCSVAFSHDADLLVSASTDRTIKIWDTMTGHCRRTLSGHGDKVVSIAFSHDAKLLVSASEDKTVKIWDATASQYTQTLERHSQLVWAIAFSPNTKLLASASADKTIKIWDAITGKYLQTLEGHNGGVNSIVFSPDTKFLVSASEDCVVKIWDVIIGKCLQTLKGHSQLLWAIAFSPNTKLLASASADKTVKIWDTITGECLQTLEGHNGGVRSIAFSPDTKLLVSASEDCTVKIWDALIGKCLQTIPTSKTLSTISFDITGQHLDTEIGLINLSLSNPLASKTGLTNTTPQQLGYGISPDRTWITWNLENLLWLPSEYRPWFWDVTASAVGIGCASGRVLLFKFSGEQTPIHS